MARKKITTRKAVRKAATPKPEGSRSIWLAGLGAVAWTRKESEKLYIRVAEESEALRARGNKAVTQARTMAKKRIDNAIAPLQKTIDANTAKFGSVVEHQVGRGLALLGVPSKADLHELSQRVSALSRQLRAAQR
jgi:poly(hydroxyalkanoate) granule-associated protein